MSTLFYREWRLAALVIGMLIALGLSSLLSIGRQEDPTITNLFATILTPYPGADPARVEALVTEKIEEELREIAEIDTITSTSRLGISAVQVELNQFISEDRIEQIWSEVRDALSDAAREFPPGVPEPEFDNDRTGAYTSISAIAPAPGAEVPMSIVRRYSELLQDRLRQVSGTKFVTLFGADEEEILVSIDPQRLASVGLSVGAVSGAIAEADAKVRAGQVRGSGNDMIVEVAGEIDGLQRIRAIPLSRTGEDQILRIGDVADVSRSVISPPASIAYADGERAILVAARMEDDLQVDTWTNAIDRERTAFEETLPAGLVHEVLFDQSGYTTERLTEVLTNLAIGMALVIVVLFLSLGWRAALIVTAAIPLTALGALNVLQMIGVTVHQMSVTGLVVALGLLVDAAIVMTDQIRQRLAKGQARIEAVAGAVRRLAVPLLASTVTTILAFLPMALLPGPAGDFVGSIAISVIVMLSISFLLAITITPALAGWALPDSDKHSAGWLSHGISTGVVGGVFARSLRLSLRYPALAVLAALVLPLTGFLSFPTLTAQFFPGVERDQFYVQLRLPNSAAIGETERFALTAGTVIAGTEGVSHVHWVIGESAPSFYYNMTKDQDGVARFAEALVTTASPEATRSAVPYLQERLDAALPEAQILVRDLTQGPPVTAPVEIRVVGPDLQVLRDIGDDIRRVMADVSEITHTRVTLVGGPPKAVFDLDEDRVRLAGLDLGGVAAQLDAALEGATGGSLIEGTEELPVRVRVGSGDRNRIEALQAIDIVPPDAAERAANGLYPGIPLSALGTVRVEPSDSPIERRDGERVNNVQGFVHLGVLPEEALVSVQNRLAEISLDMPTGYRLEIGGDADARAETVRNLASTMGLVIALTVAAIVLTFNSYRLSLIGGSVAVLSAGLSLLALAIGGYPFGIQAMIGVIGSIGVSINAAIIVLTSLKQDPRCMEGDVERMAEVVASSSRHIVSTTVTTFGGFLPLILAGGGFWPPFATAIAGGVLLSTVVSFYYTPPMFRLLLARKAATPMTTLPAATARHAEYA